MMKLTEVSIIGAGHLGQALGKKFQEYNIITRYFVRNIEKAQEQLNNLKNPPIHPLTEINKSSSIIFYTGYWQGALQTLEQCNLSDKVLVDCTNPLKFGAQGLEGLDIEAGKSAGEILQNHFPQVHIVKAFNTIAANMINYGTIGNYYPDIYLCGNNIQAKKSISSIIETFNFTAWDLGDIKEAIHIESIAYAQIKLSFSSLKGKKMISKIMSE